MKMMKKNQKTPTTEPVPCYAFAVGGMPDPVRHPIEARKVKRFMDGLEGLIGVNLHSRYQTLLIFETLNQAKIARNQLGAAGNHTGRNIMKCEIQHDDTLYVQEVADE